MASRRILKFLHFSGTIWFMITAAFLLVVAMRQAGASWWLIFSLSGYSALAILFLISIYLVAIVRSVVHTRTEIEHPLSTSDYYVVFYDIAPFFGAIAGLAGGLFAGPVEVATTVASGTLATTFITWILIDPIVSIVEATTPPARLASRWRRGRAKVAKKRINIANDKLMVSLFAAHDKKMRQWKEQMHTQIDQLVELVKDHATGKVHAEHQAVEIGANAFRQDGIECMKFVHKSCMKKLNDEKQQPSDYISIWWDGIGSWQKPSRPDCCNQS